MKLKEGSEISTSDFWYDLMDGGYIEPESLLENEEDVHKVRAAIITLEEFRDSCEDIIEEI